MTETPVANSVSANAPARVERETIAERNERIFRALPRFDSLEFDLLLKNAAAKELPAQVLVHAYRELRPSSLADVILGRLVGRDGKFVLGD